jgi:hypothetical protein
VVAGLSFLVTGCSTYLPLPSPVDRANGMVRLSLTDEARGQRFGALGSDLVAVEGEVESSNDSAVTVAVSQVERVAADNQSIRNETVTIPTRYIGRVEQKRTLMGRSVLLAGAVVGGVILLGLRFGGGDVGTGHTGGPPTQGQ